MPSMAVPHKNPSSGIFYFRVAVPKDLQKPLGKAEIKKSLRTKSYSEAKAKFAVAYADAQELFLQFRQEKTLSQKDIEILSQRWLKSAVPKMEASGSFEDYVRLTSWGGDEGYVSSAEHIESALDSNYSDQLKVAGSEVDALIAEYCLFVLKGSTQYRRLVRKICWKMLDLYHIALQRHVENWTPLLPSKIALADHQLGREGVPLISRVTVAGYKSLGDIVDGFIQHKISRGDWIGKTEADVREVLSLFVSVHGAKSDPNAITREQFRSFMALLGKIPLRYNLKKEFTGLLLPDVISLGEKLGMETLAQKTVKKKFVFVLSLFKFAALEGWVDKNQSGGLTVKIDGTGSNRRVFTTQDLNLLFKETREPSRPSEYWMPRIALTTGMRSNEILQLTVSDVEKSDGGVWYFDVNKRMDRETGKPKRLKTKNSERKIPIPEKLIGLGFLNYVSSIGVGRLFQCVQLGGDGTYSFIYSKRFNKMLGSVGVKPKAASKQIKDFHSFRHTFRSNAREFGVRKEEVELMGGWSSSDASAGDDYGREFTMFVGRLKEAIDLIQYGEVHF